MRVDNIRNAVRLASSTRPGGVEGVRNNQMNSKAIMTLSCTANLRQGNAVR